MATERQITANRANAAKSTGPVTPEGKRNSSQNASLRRLDSGAAELQGILKGESLRRYNQLAEEFIIEFQPRNSAEAALVQTMILARWRLLCSWGTQTAALRKEIARARPRHPSAGSAFAAAFFSLAENSASFARQHRLEAHYQRQFNHALTQLLKLRETPKSCAAPHLPQPAGETEACDFLNKANSAAVSAPLLKQDLIHKS
jgi:hypothetical protein